MNPLSLEQDLYLLDCRIWDDAYSQQFPFCWSTTLSCFCISRFLQLQYLLLVHLSVLLKAVENMISTMVNDICSFISWTPQKKIVPLELNAGMCYHVFLLLDCLLIFSSNLSRQSFVIKLIVLSRFFAYLLSVHYVNNNNSSRLDVISFQSLIRCR